MNKRYATFQNLLGSYEHRESNTAFECLKLIPFSVLQRRIKEEWEAEEKKKKEKEEKKKQEIQKKEVIVQLDWLFVITYLNISTEATSLIFD